jgi:uncharacterized LabA/DUF88 family protein
MSEKAIVFIDGSWLYRCRTALFTKLGEENFEIDYAKLPKLICEDVANTLDEDISLVKTMYFGTIPSTRSGFNTSKQYAFYDFLNRSCGYDTFIHEVDVGNEEIRSSCGWVDVSMATNLVYYAALPAVMDIAIVIGDSGDLAPALRRVRSLGKRVQLVNISTAAAPEYSRTSDFPPIFLDDHAADVKLVREQVVRTCKKCGQEENTTWAGIDFFCSNCRGKYRGN